MPSIREWSKKDSDLFGNFFKLMRNPFPLDNRSDDYDNGGDHSPETINRIRKSEDQQNGDYDHGDVSKGVLISTEN
ncbi:hypothetical protein FY140_04440 [Agrobacterium tumefaciens]|uniref:hypothetical protein n=1 Tax=Agrobacterium tumefaciens TaxID=358 RepID=UPI0021D395E7|nr:hypothetical protein [Agrobacterium tumefaciens]UXT20018.1 hypothetical protein FY140_04440 [Agrobacterium tumefaciens]